MKVVCGLRNIILVLDVRTARCYYYPMECEGEGTFFPGFADDRVFLVPFTDVRRDKAAFLCFYWNLVSEIDDTNLFKYSAIGTGVVLFSTFAAINIIFLTYCLPLSRQW